MPHAVVREVPDVERIGEIIQICQFIRNFEFSGLFRHLNTSKSRLPVDINRHVLNIYTGVPSATEAVMSRKAALANCRMFYGWSS